MVSRSQLVYRDIPAATQPEQATVIALHGHEGGLDDLAPIARSLGSDLRIAAPEAARGVYRGIDLLSHTWYGGPDRLIPEPASPGGSPHQIEQVVYDLRE